MLRAIDIQHVLVQSNSMERVQQTQQQHPDQQQRYLDIQAKEDKKLSKETVKHAEEPGHARVEEKKDEERAKHGRPEQHQTGQHQPEQAEKQEISANPDPDPDKDEHGSIIDIVV